MRHSHTALAVGSLVALFLTFVRPVAGLASQPSRTQFVERAEQICKTETHANGSVLAGVESMIRGGKLRRAARHLRRAAGSLERVKRRLSEIPRPPADRERITRWLGFAKRGPAHLRSIGRALDRGRRNRVQSDANRLLREARQANGVVAGFGFNYCRMDPARFS